MIFFHLGKTNINLQFTILGWLMSEMKKKSEEKMKYVEIRWKRIGMKNSLLFYLCYDFNGVTYLKHQSLSYIPTLASFLIFTRKINSCNEQHTQLTPLHVTTIYSFCISTIWICKQWTWKRSPDRQLIKRITW